MHSFTGSNNASFFDSYEAEIKALASFTEDAHSKGNRVLHYSSTFSANDIKYFLQLNGFRGGIVDSAITVQNISTLFCNSGVLSIPAAFDTLTSFVKGGIWVSIDHSWLCSTNVNEAEFIEFEQKFHDLIKQKNSMSLCHYNTGSGGNDFLQQLADMHDYSTTSKCAGGADGISATDANLMYRSLPEKKRTMDIRKLLPISASLFQEKLTSIVKENRLTKQERRVLDLLLHFKANLAISDMLFITDNTVKQHIKNIFRKLKVGSRCDLFFIFYKNMVEL